MSDNSTQKKDRKFFFRRKGEMQGTSAPPLLTIPRVTNTAIARVPNPPAHDDFYFIELVGAASTFIVIETDTGGEVTVELTSEKVSDIIAAIEAATACTVAFSNRLLTIHGAAADNWLKIKPYNIDPGVDAARALGFSYGEFFPAYSKEGWDAPAPGKNKETFVQRYENNISSAVNRGLSALASNIEEHHRFLSEELVVPRFINTVENSAILDVWEDGGLIKGLKLQDRAYISDIKNHSPASLEKFFVLTDKFGACSVTVGDREEPVRICDVTTGEPDALTLPRRVPYFDALGATTEFGAIGDGNSIIGLQKQASEGLIGEFTVFKVVDNSKIRVLESTTEVYPGCVVTWPGDDLNSGDYTVVAIDGDIIELLATDSGRDSLTTDAPVGGVVSIYHSTVISVDETLYLLFDTPIDSASVVAQRGFGLLYGARTTVKDFLTTTLMGNLKGQAVSDIVIRSLQAIRGPNSRNYRSMRVGDPDGYDGDVDSSADGGDLISLETLANRSLLGRDAFDLSGGTLEVAIPLFYSLTDGSKANAYAGTPLTLYGEVGPVVESFSAITATADPDASRWNNRLGGPGPFKGVIAQGAILQSDGVFLPTDVGLTVKLTEDEPAADNQKQLLRVWTISKYISPDSVLLSCPDLPGYLSYAVASLEVDFTFGARDARNISAGALLRLDKTTKNGIGFDGAKVNALVLADHSGITGVVTLTPIEHSSSEFAEKLEFSTSIAEHLELSLPFAANSSLIYQLHPQDKDNPLVTSLVLTPELAGLPAGAWSTEVIGGFTEVTFTYTPVMGATVVEVISADGTFDGLLLVRKVQVSPEGNYILHLCDFALNNVTLPGGTVGRCRLFNLNVAQGLRSAKKRWAGASSESLAFNSFFGTGATPDGIFSEGDATVARFGGTGSLDSVVEIRASGDQPLPFTYVPRTALSVWASSPSQGIEVNTTTIDDPAPTTAIGGTGIRVVSFTGFRAHVEDLAGAAEVYPGTAAIIATQIYDMDHAVRNDPVKRDPVAIFATQAKDATPNATGKIIVPKEYDTNAQVISYVHEDVYQRSDDRAKWAVTIYSDAQQAEISAYIKIYSNTAGYIDYTVVMTEGAINSVVVNSGLKQLQITLKAGLHYTAVQLVAAVNATDEFSAEVSDGGAWTVNPLGMPGSGTVSTAISEFTPSSIIQHDINNAIEAIQGDVVVNDGIFVIKGENRITGVGSHLIPVNPEVPVQPLDADAEEAIDPSTGYDLGEEKIFYEEYTTFETGLAQFVPSALLTLDERNINRKVTFTNFAPGDVPEDETITRYITGINGTAYTLNMPIVFNNWAGESQEQSGTITVYGRRWRNIYAQNIETSTLQVELPIENLTVTNLTVENAVIDNAIIDNLAVQDLRVRGTRRKFIPASDFTEVLNTNSFLEFQNVKTLPSSVGWMLNVGEETEFNEATTARLFYSWSPEISDSEYAEDEHSVLSPLKYKITGITVHYRYFGAADLSPIDIHVDAVDSKIDYALVSARTHYYTPTTMTDQSVTWFAGGYDLPIDAASKGIISLSNSGFSGIIGVDPFPVLTMQDGDIGTFAGYCSFEVVLRPQLLFCGLTITYQKVTA